PAELRNALASRSVRDAIASWRRDDYTLQYCEGIPCEHKKKQLDENGFGTIELQVKILDLPT
ncbi:MAG: hypothetical protein LBP30_08405, partial [Clostridiales Family XIII bacterium]|nr:hypothetical protein [Clostridiales Family XIII bacterium]